MYTINKTKKAFRLIVFRWLKETTLFEPEQYCYSAIAMDLESSAEEAVREYNNRDQIKNIIKELKI